MAKAARPWTVLSPSPLRTIDDNIWCIDDGVPGLPGATRRMVIVRRSDGKLLFYNAVPVGEDTLAAVRALGTPAQLFITNRFHTIDAAAFRDKLGLDAYGPPKTLEDVRKAVPVAPYAELPPDPAIAVQTVDGFKTGEGVLVVKSGPRATVVVSDLLVNQRHGRGFNGFMMRLAGFTGDRPKLPKVVKMRILENASAVRETLVRLADTPGLVRVIPSHGDIVDKDPAGVLRDIAATV
jgi:hypothetical protein